MTLSVYYAQHLVVGVQDLLNVQVVLDYTYSATQHVSVLVLLVPSTTMEDVSSALKDVPHAPLMESVSRVEIVTC